MMDNVDNLNNQENILVPQTPSPASALVGDPSKFGRVGDDGIVYVITPEGEKAVGSYPGKTHSEALAYFVRKFEALASEVALLGARIKSGAMVPSDAAAAVSKLREQLTSLNGVGDLVALAHSIEQIPTLIDEHRSAYEARKEAEKAVKEAKRAQAQVVKEKIVAEAETHALSENWKFTGDRLKVLLDEWKAAARLDKKTDAELWKRFSSSRNKFDKRRRTHFAQLETQSAAVAQTKAQIIEEAKSLANSKDWLATANRFKELMNAWKAAGRGKKNVDTKLWEEFKTAQDTFFAAKKADLEKRQGTMATNLAKREALLPEFEALLPVTNVKDARKKFRDLMDQWERIGMTERNKRATFDAKIAKIQSEIDELHQQESRKSDPTAIAHANTVVQGLLDAIESYEKQAAKAEAAGNAAKAMVAREAAAARRGWLEEAQKGLSEFKKP